MQPKPRQQAVRQWILFLPLTTALLGSFALQSVPLNEVYDFLPAIFLLGALIVTSAMLHERHTYQVMLDLAERAHLAYSRLDTMHGLAQELNKPLNTVQVAEAVLAYALRFLQADEGAFWLRRDLLPSGVGVAMAPGPRTNDVVPQPVTTRWQCVTAHGFAEPHRAPLLDAWSAILEHNRCLDAVLQLRTGAQAEDSLELQSVFGADDSAFSLPIVWEGECAGILLVNNRQQRLPSDGVAFLTDMRLATGPALQNAFQFQAATERAEIDGLTRLYNHRAIQERVLQEVARVSRERHHNREVKFAVAMMDLTDFKLFNDAYGHAMGDEVLRSVGDTMRRVFRISDIVGRYGGDEFVALLPDTDQQGARTLCQRIIETLRNTVLTAEDGSPINIRLACGVAAFPGDGETSDELLAVADERLYAAKDLGQLLLTEERANDGAVVEVPPAAVPRPDWSAIGLLDSIITAIDQKDHYTRQHCEKVWHYTSLVARRMELSREQREALEIGSLVFDVGKIVLPHALLRKPGRLSPDEQMVLQQHPVFGALIVRDVPHLEIVLQGVRHHHEYFDGTGYPDQLSGESIPLIARILAVADSFAAMTSERPYQPQLSYEQALAEIKSGIGSQFDAAIVAVFEATLRENIDLNVGLPATAAVVEHSSHPVVAPALTTTKTLPEVPAAKTPLTPLRS